MAQVSESVRFEVCERDLSNDTLTILATEPTLQDAQHRAEIICRNPAECMWDRTGDRHWFLRKSIPPLEIFKRSDYSGMP
jgi:hypothetical protein